MADISSEISDFQNAVYGEEVRGSMISLAEKLNDVCEDAESTVATFSDGFEAATAAANDAAASANTAASAANSAAGSANTAATNAVNAMNASNSAEVGRAAAETARAAAETARVQAETERAQAESNRAAAENSRVTAETARAGSETNRQSAEQTRQENETARNSAEMSRITAEATRSANETARNSAESTRASSETSRNNTFAQMQAAFADMQELVVPPATTTTLGGIIVGEGLSVESDGTLSFEAGDFLTIDDAEATYATIEGLNGKADAIHVHSAADITSGTLSVARGGTGVSTAAEERERLGLGSTTGALPIANGGTGATTAADALSALLASNAVPVANGGTGATTAAGARTNLGITPANIGALPYSGGVLDVNGTSAYLLFKTTAIASFSPPSGVTACMVLDTTDNGLYWYTA